MNNVTDCYKSDVNIMMTLGGTATFWDLIADIWLKQIGGHANF
jgi:hypothetical protein